MAKDARLDLGRYIQNPFDKSGQISKRLDFNDLFKAKPETGEYPWNPSRFTERDLLKRMMTRKVTLNPTLSFTPNTPFFDDNQKVTEAYDMFGLGRFNPVKDYNFNEGRANTLQRPQDQPDYNPNWIEAYKLSPTLNPEKAASNPMPRTKNPDPRGFLMGMAESKVESETTGNLSVAQLLENKNNSEKNQQTEEEKQGEKTITNVEQDFNFS